MIWFPNPPNQGLCHRVLTPTCSWLAFKEFGASMELVSQPHRHRLSASSMGLHELLKEQLQKQSNFITEDQNKQSPGLQPASQVSGWSPSEAKTEPITLLLSHGFSRQRYIKAGGTRDLSVYLTWWGYLLFSWFAYIKGSNCTQFLN